MLCYERTCGLDSDLHVDLGAFQKDISLGPSLLASENDLHVGEEAPWKFLSTESPAQR